jgi:hypothetical protein
MGIQGAGKTTHVQDLVRQGYEWFNRDEQGGTLRGLARRLAARIETGGTRFVLDNTYPTRALRSEIVDIGRANGIPVRCLFLDTPLEAAQVNVVHRLVARYGRLPTPAEMRTLQRTDPQVLPPTLQYRFRRELEPPALDEGFVSIETVPFVRQRAPADRTGMVIAAEALADPRVDALVDASDAVLVVAWRPDGEVPATPREVAVCPHPGGPPVCWCRPPLPVRRLPAR